MLPGVEELLPPTLVPAPALLWFDMPELPDWLCELEPLRFVELLPEPLPESEEPAGCAERSGWLDWPLCMLPLCCELPLFRPELLEPDVLSRFQDCCVVLPESEEPAGRASRLSPCCIWPEAPLLEPLLEPLSEPLWLLLDGLE